MPHRTISYIRETLSNVFNSAALQSLSKPRRGFITSTLLLFLSIKGKINFLQLARYGSRSEQSCRNQFNQPFDFDNFNADLIRKSFGEDKMVIAFDPSYIPKSGKCTHGLGRFWSGKDSAVRNGLEIAAIAVVNVKQNTAMHLGLEQTALQQTENDKDITLLGFYADAILKRKELISQFSTLVVADAFFSRKPFVDKIVDGNLDILSRLNKKARMRYLFTGEKTGKRGRPKKFDGKVDWDNIETDRFVKETDSKGHTVLSAELYSVGLERNVKVAVCVGENNKADRSQIYFSTDLLLSGLEIRQYYSSRFQIEFLFRDAKQHTGLTSCQARDKEKLEFHFNTALTAVNLAKKHWLKNRKDQKESFSMASYKTLFHNAMMLELFINAFGIDPNLDKNKQISQRLIAVGKIAA